MKVAISLKILLSVIKRMLVVAGVILYCSTPAHAGKQKAFDKYDPPSDLILTLPDPLLITKKTDPSSDQNLVPNNYNSTQTSALKRTPVNVNCDVDVLQNTLGAVPLTNRIFGECDVHYHF